MSLNESLEDVAIRERQLEAHILQSAEYRKRADRDLKRLVMMLYLAIALLFLFQLLFTYNSIEHVPLKGTLLVTVTSILGVLNCLLLIQTKTWLHRLNEAWLAPQEKIALETLKNQRQEILTRLPRHGGDSRGSAELN
jgi:cell division septal protein FtsQ